MKNPYLLKKRAPQNIWYYKLKEETSYHSTGCKIKAKAEQYVQELLYGQENLKDDISFKQFE